MRAKVQVVDKQLCIKKTQQEHEKVTKNSEQEGYEEPYSL